MNVLAATKEVFWRVKLNNARTHDGTQVNLIVRFGPRSPFGVVARERAAMQESIRESMNVQALSLDKLNNNASSSGTMQHFVA